MLCTTGYAPFETLKQDPLFIARSGGVARAAAYLDKAQSRHNTSAMGAWHPFARVDPEECMPGRASIVFMSGNQGGIGSDGKNPGTVCAYECPAPAAAPAPLSLTISPPEDVESPIAKRGAFVMNEEDDNPVHGDEDGGRQARVAGGPLRASSS